METKKKESNQKEIKLRLTKIKEKDFSCTDLPEKVLSDFNENKLRFNIGASFKPKIEDDEISIIININSDYEVNKQTKFFILKYQTELTFNIKEIKNIVKIKNNALSMPDNLSILLINIGMGTVRGMLHIRTSGKVISKYPLPLVSPEILLKKIKSKSQKQTV